MNAAVQQPESVWSENVRLKREVEQLKQMLEDIGSNGPAGMKMAVKRIFNPPFPSFGVANPARWRATALGEFYEYELTSDQVRDVISRGLNFGPAYDFKVSAGHIGPLHCRVTIGDPDVNP